MTTAGNPRVVVDGSGDLDHQQIVVHRGTRSRLPVIVAVHSTVRGPAIGGCRLWRYRDWREGLTDALRLSAGMTAKSALAGLRHGGGKTVVALPDEPLAPSRRRDVLLDVGDTIEALNDRYWTGPDVGTTPQDMATIAERSPRVFCRPRHLGGSGDSSPHTANGVLACLPALCGQLDGRPEVQDRRITVVGMGHVGELIARGLAAAGADLAVTDIESDRRRVADELGARWLDPPAALTADAEVLVPAAMGGQLTDDNVPALRCTAIAGPANNQLAHDQVADQLHDRGILWAPDYLVSAGGIVYATGVEIDHASPDQALDRVQRLAARLTEVLGVAATERRSPHRTARELVEARIRR